MDRWQYQQIAEPVALTPETPQVDKWYHPFTEPKRLSRFVAAVFVTSLAFVPVVQAAPETVTVDKWLGQSITPTVRPKRLVDYGSFAIDPRLLTLKESVLLDKWFVQNPEQVFRKKIPFWQGWFSTNLVPPVPESVTLDKWFIQPADYFRKKRLADYGVYSVDARQLTRPENVTFDKWFVQPTDYFRKKRLVDYGLYTVDSSALTLEGRVSTGGLMPSYKIVRDASVSKVNAGHAGEGQKISMGPIAGKVVR